MRATLSMLLVNTANRLAWTARLRLAASRLSGTGKMEIVVFGGLLPVSVLFLLPQPLRGAAMALLIAAPLIVGLKYGLAAGATSAFLAAAGVALAWWAVPGLMAHFPRVETLTGLLVGVVAGETRDRQDILVTKLRAICDYREARLQQLDTAHKALQLSHAWLQQRVGGGCSLRTALERLHRDAEDLSPHDPEGRRQLGEKILEILGDTATHYSAAVFLCDSDGTLGRAAVARIGNAQDGLVDHPDVVEVMTLGRRARVRTGANVSDGLIATVPLLDAAGTLHGVVAISDMAFTAVRPDTFQKMDVLARNMANIFSHRTRQLATPRSRDEFYSCLRTAHADVLHTGVPTAVLACEIRQPVVERAVFEICRDLGRGLDQTWVLRTYP